MILGNHFDFRPRVRIMKGRYAGELGYVLDQDESLGVLVELDGHFSGGIYFWWDYLEVYREETFGVIGAL